MRRTTPTNPAALAWALVLGHEARATEADEVEVMYHEEKLIDGVWCWRGTPDGDWQPMGAGMLTRLIAEQAARIAEIEARLAAAQERERGLVTLIGDLEWIYDKEYCFKYCPECENVESSGHAEGCRTAAALAAAQPASDGGEYRCPHCGSDNPGTEPECPECGR